MTFSKYRVEYFQYISFLPLYVYLRKNSPSVIAENDLYLLIDIFVICKRQHLKFYYNAGDFKMFRFKYFQSPTIRREKRIFKQLRAEKHAS